MHQTPWTKKGSSVPSSRTRPTPDAAQNSQGKGRQSPSSLPKSKEVRRLEFLLKGLRDSSGRDKDPKGGCFCQAREHPLSTYAPMCYACGMILCSINLPQYCCPHCSASLLTVAIRKSLVVQLESQISETIAAEVRARERAIEEARKAAGAFPTLTAPAGKPTTPIPQTPTPLGNQAYKVLSLNSKTKKVIVSSYTTPLSSRPASRAVSEDEEPIRVPPPPAEVASSKRQLDPTRPWENLMGSGAKYIPLSGPDRGGASNESGRKSRRNGKDKGNANNNVAGL